MTGNGYLQIGLYLAALLLLAWPLGLYMARVYAGELPSMCAGRVRWKMGFIDWPVSSRTKA